VPNRLHPKHLYTGITLVGKKAQIPARVVVGRNCIVNSDAQILPGAQIATGETV